MNHSAYPGFLALILVSMTTAAVLLFPAVVPLHPCRRGCDRTPQSRGGLQTGASWRRMSAFGALLPRPHDPSPVRGVDGY